MPHECKRSDQNSCSIWPTCMCWTCNSVVLDVDGEHRKHSNVHMHVSSGDSHIPIIIIYGSFLTMNVSCQDRQIWAEQTMGIGEWGLQCKHGPRDRNVHVATTEIKLLLGGSGAIHGQFFFCTWQTVNMLSDIFHMLFKWPLLQVEGQTSSC